MFVLHSVSIVQKSFEKLPQKLLLCSKLITEQILGAVILGFGVWIIADKSSFVSVLQTSSSSLQVGAYVFIGVGAITMLMGLLGCIGAVNEVRCLLGLYFVFLLLILIAQVTVGVLFYFNAGKLKQEVGSMVMDIIQNYKTNASSSREERLQEAWDYVQAQVKCCGWASFYNWTDNLELRNSTENIYPCSCEETMEEDNQYIVKKGFCKVSNSSSDAIFHEEWPVYKEETMFRSMACADTRDCVDVHGPCCHQRSCGSPYSMLLLTVKDKEATFVVTSKTADSELRKGDIEGFCDNPYPHPIPPKVTA
ncbi:CD82 antigen [Cricetulus griseus]